MDKEKITGSAEFTTDLANEARAGSKEAFCRLYGMYKDNLYRYALYKLADPVLAEDAVSECVLAAWKGIRKLKSADAFGSWIFRILHNVCAGMIRTEIADRERVAKAGSELETTREESPSLSVELREALAQLSDDEQEIVLLSVISGMNSTEISSITGYAAGSVRSKLARSLAKMREFLS